MNGDGDHATLRPADVRRRFDRAASGFDGADFVHAAMRDGLLRRLDPVHIDATTVVDAGCGTGSACRLLARRFRRSRVVGVDLSFGMLSEAARKRSWLTKLSMVQADATAMPFADHTIDVMFANLLLPWIGEPERLFREAARVLRKDGLLAFSTLGPDSLAELRRAWQSVDTGVHVNVFLDMHDIGDAAVRSGLRDPVLDVDRLTVTYRDAAAVFRDLTATGARNCLEGRRDALVGKGAFGRMRNALERNRVDGVIHFELELVYGHCWGSGALTRAGEFHIAPTQIRRRD